MLLCDERRYPTERSFLLREQHWFSRCRGALGEFLVRCAIEKRAVGTQNEAANRIRFGVQVIFTSHK